MGNEQSSSGQYRPRLNFDNAEYLQRQPQPPGCFRCPPERSLQDRMKSLECTVKQYEMKMQQNGCTDMDPHKDFNHLMTQMSNEESKYRAKEITYLQKIEKLEQMVASTECAYSKKILEMEKRTRELNNCVGCIQREFNELQGVAHGLLVEREQRMQAEKNSEDPAKLKQELECERRRNLKLMNEVQCTNNLLLEQQATCQADANAARSEALQYKKKLVNVECDLAQMKAYTEQLQKFKDEHEVKMMECHKQLKQREEICKKMQERLDAEGLGGIVQRFNRAEVQNLPTAVEGLQIAYRNARALEGKTSFCCSHLVYVSHMTLKLAKLMLGTNKEINCDSTLDDDVDDAPSGSNAARATTATSPQRTTIRSSAAPAEEAATAEDAARSSQDITVAWAFVPQFPFIKSISPALIANNKSQPEQQQQQQKLSHIEDNRPAPPSVAVKTQVQPSVKAIPNNSQMRVWLCRILEETISYLRPAMPETVLADTRANEQQLQILGDGQVNVAMETDAKQDQIKITFSKTIAEKSNKPPTVKKKVSSSQVEECLRLYRSMHAIPQTICRFLQSLMDSTDFDETRKNAFLMDFIIHWHNDDGFRPGAEMVYRIAIEEDNVCAHKADAQLLMEYNYENLVGVLKILKGISKMLGKAKLPKILQKVQNRVSKALLMRYRSRMEDEFYFTVYYRQEKDSSNITKKADPNPSKAIRTQSKK